MAPLFGPYDEDNPCGPWEAITAMMRGERLLAEIAYIRAMGWPEPTYFEEDDRTGTFDDLMESYTRYGLAQSNVQALELIKDIERQAVELAQARRQGPSPGRS